MTTTLTETFHDEFVTAIEGGINYWSGVHEYDWDRPDWFAVIEDIEGTEHRVTEDTIRLGFQFLAGFRLLADEGQDVRATLRAAARSLMYSGGTDTEAWEGVQDADTADVVVQYGLFGKLIYG